MKFYVIFALSVQFYCIHPTEAVMEFLDRILGKEKVVPPPRLYPSLPLLLGFSRKCVIAPVTISCALHAREMVKKDPSLFQPDDEITKPTTQFVFVCPAESKEDEQRIKDSVTGQPLFIQAKFQMGNEENQVTGETNALEAPQLISHSDKEKGKKKVNDASKEFIDGPKMYQEGETSKTPKTGTTLGEIEEIEEVPTAVYVAEDERSKNTEASSNKVEHELAEPVIEEVEPVKRQYSDVSSAASDEENKTPKLALEEDNEDGDTQTKAVMEKMPEKSAVVKGGNVEGWIDYESRYKCFTEISPSIIDYTEMGHTHPPYHVYLTGYEVYMGDEAVYAFMPEHLQPKLKENFHWFNALTILFNSTTLDVRCVSYCEIYRRFNLVLQDPDPIFMDYEFGKKLLYGDLDIGNIYRTDNQREVFTQIFPDETEMKNYYDGEEKVLFEVHLAPLNVFSSIPALKAASTYGNVAPIWKAIRYESWRGLEIFVSRLTMVFKALHVVTGTYGVLELDNRGPIYLATNNRISVPLAFYKIIDYPQDNETNFYMVVVVINNPYKMTDPKPICPESVCEKYSWDEMDVSDYTRGERYCCELTQDVIELLQIEGRVHVGNVLNLMDKLIGEEKGDKHSFREFKF